jgi:hypothetical protein
MAGSPLKRQRKLGVRLEDGRVIAFPRMPRVVDLPPGWRHFSVAQKIEHLIGFDQAREILSWWMAELDPLRLSLKMQVVRVVFAICLKAALDGATRERDRERVFEEMAREYAALKAAATDV